MELRASRAGAPFCGLLAVLVAAACASSEQENDGPGTGGASTGGAAATGGAAGAAATGGAGGTAAGGGGQGGAGGGCGAELCDGVDNDCDDVVDEDCPCVDGQTRPCFEGDPGLVGVGNCAQGTQVCDLAGVWGACEGDVLPVPETCDGHDEDCDHAVDEDLGTVTCGLGVCQTTVEACANGVPVPCIPGTGSQTEACDGLDNDCDGTTDEGCTCLDGATQPCYEGDPALIGTGECLEGEQLCASGQWGACLGDVTPTTETCNGKDDDCNGTVDNGNPGGGAACNTGLPGVCAPGHRQCANGTLGCEQDSQASADLCDGLDNDCNASSADGSADPGLGVACDSASDSDLCPDGGVVCSGGSLVCADDADHALDVCDGLDNDCDAASADGTEDPLAGTACDGPDSDLCVEGSRLCSAGTLLCTDNTSSSTDLCDGLDNDCDAASADGSEDPGAGQPCDSPADSDLCATGLSTCVGGTLGCGDDAASTLDLCNGQNDDCDAASPDGSEDPAVGAACDNPADSDLCATGVSSCVGGALACSDDAVSSLDACNGADDDCDPASADGSEDAAVGLPCDSPADSDLCATGLSTCVGGALGCSDDAASALDLCNGQNDDCDAASPDGSEDPSVGQPCDNPADSDLCTTGISSCVGGALACSDDAVSALDLCNGLDDDCDPASPDGSEDVGVGQACDSPADSDLCATGVSSCVGGVLACSDDAASALDVCNGGDDDCDPASTDGSEDAAVGQPCDNPADSD
ncbi:MAG: hypothetical protein IT373_07190, partial [Polyangiaceae bacterium]|nr:hypothetical protein [Polyangiaceae bacterium]